LTLLTSRPICPQGHQDSRRRERKLDSFSYARAKAEIVLTGEKLRLPGEGFRKRWDCASLQEGLGAGWMGVATELVSAPTPARTPRFSQTRAKTGFVLVCESQGRNPSHR